MRTGLNERRAMAVASKATTAVLIACLIMAMISGGECNLLKVGGKQGWTNVGVNYTLWAADQTFYVEDWLKFLYDRQYFDVIEVNKTNYENCNPDGFIQNITRGAGRDVVQLKEARPYYFICSRGYCWSGMKLAINVQERPAAAPVPEKSDAPGFIIAPALYIITFLCVLNIF